MSVGVFDSGLGGLSVLHEMRKRLPEEDFVYVADSGHVPYGDKAPEYINERSLRIGEFLVDQHDVRAIVIACNTASATAIMPLRNRFPGVPVIGMEPAVKPAMAVTRTRRVGVLATVGTLKSARFAALLDRFADTVEVVMQPAPGLVECVERGDLTGAETRRLVESFVRPLRERGVDVIVLGCTHYPFLREAIAEVAGEGVSLIDTGAAVARQVQRKLEEVNGRRLEGHGRELFFSSGDLSVGEGALRKLWGPGAQLAGLPSE
ncbi:MAG TPA: glutamate racemase [Bdellovibrionota bacterium]|jgi:glutamate racemase|nr:glutamate racemase [Bdellovibrionota bacterium]